MNQGWYKDIGYQIWMNMFFLMILPHVIEPFYFYLMEKISIYRAKK